MKRFCFRRVHAICLVACILTFIAWKRQCGRQEKLSIFLQRAFVNVRYSNGQAMLHPNKSSVFTIPAENVVPWRQPRLVKEGFVFAVSDQHFYSTFEVVHITADGVTIMKEIPDSFPMDRVSVTMPWK